jgi:predicted DNA-binding transcriptional regulator AlpA
MPRATQRGEYMLDRVISLRQAAECTGLSVATIRRLIERGDGPPLTMLSPRRQGIRESHLTKWLNSRVRQHDDEEAA